MIKAKAIILTGLMAMSSCIPSLFPVYTVDDLVTDDRLVGTWDAGEYGTCVVERLDYNPHHDFLSPDWTDPGDRKTYRLVVRDVEKEDTLEAAFVLHLLLLGGQYYLNFYPADYELQHGFLSWHMVEANNFCRVWISQETISLGFLDPAFLKELIDENRIKIAHVRHDSGILLTARTRELQKFLIKYGNEKDAMLEKYILRRI
jgi:hypothetical protein